MDWLGLLAIQGTLKSLLQHDSSKTSILQCSAFFIVQLQNQVHFILYDIFKIKYPYITWFLTEKWLLVNSKKKKKKILGNDYKLKLFVYNQITYSLQF